MQDPRQDTRTVILQGETWAVDAAPPKPKLPRTFFQTSLGDILRCIIYMVGLWVLPALVSAWVYYYTALPMPLQITIYLMMGWLSGHGMVWGEWIGHDAVHGSLLPKHKKLGLFITLMTSSVILGFMNMGFAARHLDHHRYTNRATDPDTAHYTKYQGVLGKLLLARAHKNLTYIYAAYLAFRGDPHHMPPGYTLREIRWLVVANAVFVIFWIATYAIIAVHSIPLFMFFVLLPTVSLIAATGALTYQQHGGTGGADPSDPWRTTRSMTSWLWTFLYGGGGFHLEHHLYPLVPFFNLPKVHRYLKEQGYFRLRGVPLDNDSFGGYKYFSSRYPYPEPEVRQPAA